MDPLAVVSLGKIRKNAERVRRRAGVGLIAVVKDDAYGHGAINVALALRGVVSAFAVATVAEGEALRLGGVGEDILVLSPAITEEEVLRACGHGLILSLSSRAGLSLVRRAADKFGLAPRTHLCVNTGMNRYGFRPESVKSVCRAAEGLGVEGIYSHLYDPFDRAALSRQKELFSRAAEQAGEFFPALLRHLSATGGLLAGGEQFDAVRVGLALYGYLPEGGSGLAVEHAMKIYASVSRNGRFTGGGIGYGRAEGYGALHTLLLGYGDGFSRLHGFGIGKLCMDACVAAGSGKFGERRLVLSDAEAYAKLCGTSVYEALVNIGKGAEKKYV